MDNGTKVERLYIECVCGHHRVVNVGVSGRTCPSCHDFEVKLCELLASPPDWFNESE